MRKLHNHHLKKMVGTIFLLTLTGILFLYVKYQSQQVELREKTREQLRKEITDLIIEYQNGETQTIDLSKLSSISWDRLYIFGPYIPLENIDKLVGSPWMPDKRYAPPRPFSYLIFTLNRKVVQYVEYPIDDFVNFSGKDHKNEGYERSQSLFVLNKYGTVLWLYQ
ncbi:MAG: hypothetical protein QM730_18805 [Anaerolineales bacterium]